MKEQFQKGQKVEVKNYERHEWTRAIYIAYDDITGAEHKHIAKAKGPGSAEAWKYCRPRRPNLKVDDPVWVRQKPNERWEPRHFKEWADDKIICWANGTTSHSAEPHWHNPQWEFYRTTPSDEE